MTCPHCRQWILERLSDLRSHGLKDQLKLEQKKYLPLIRKGTWKIEGGNTVYCIFPSIEANGTYCCYHLDNEELRQFLNIPKQRPEHKAIYDHYWALRLKQVSVSEACQVIESETGYKTSTIKKIVHTRNGIY